LPSPIEVTRYHSLVIPPGQVPDALRVTATATDDGEVMAVEHREHPVVGVQFHPESAATQYGYAMLDRFLRGDRSHPADLPPLADGAREPAEPVR
jgi:anthranilate synthase component 2